MATTGHSAAAISAAVAPPADGKAARAFAEWYRREGPTSSLWLDVDGRQVEFELATALPERSFAVQQLGRPVQLPKDGIPLLLALPTFGGGYLPEKDADEWAAAFAKHLGVASVTGFQTDLTVKGLTALAVLPNLAYLNLHECAAIDAAALREVAKLPALRILNLDGKALKAGKYTLADVQKLQDARPQVTITQDESQPVPGLKNPDG